MLTSSRSIVDRDRQAVKRNTKSIGLTKEMMDELLEEADQTKETIKAIKKLENTRLPMWRQTAHN